MSDLLNKLPRLRISTASLIQRADRSAELLSYDSENKDMFFAADKKGVVIFTHKNGYLRLDTKEIDALTEELMNIKEDIERWN